MKTLLVLAFSLVFVSAASAQKAFGYDIPKKIDFSVLSGTWQMNKSKDLKLFTSVRDSLKLNGVVGYGYIKSRWTFVSDTTGYVIIPKSKFLDAELKI